MGNLRISTDENFSVLKNRMQTSERLVLDDWARISTGKRIQHMSDDPAGSVQLFCIDRIISRVEQSIENVEVVSNKLNLEEIQISSLVASLQRCKELSLRANNGTVDYNGHLGIAVELTNLLDSIVSILNSRSIDGRYVFGGGHDEKPPVIYTSSRYHTEILPDTNINVGSHPFPAQQITFDVDGTIDTINLQGKETSKEICELISQINGIRAKPLPLEATLILPTGLSPTETAKFNINGTDFEFSSNSVPLIQKELDQLTNNDANFTAEVDVTGTQIHFNIKDGRDLHVTNLGGSSPNDLKLQVYSVEKKPLPPTTLIASQEVYCMAAIEFSIDKGVDNVYYSGTGSFSNGMVPEMIKHGDLYAESSHGPPYEHYVLNGYDTAQREVNISINWKIKANDSATSICLGKMYIENNMYDTNIIETIYDFIEALKFSDKEDLSDKLGWIIEEFDAEIGSTSLLQADIGGRQSILGIAKESNESSQYYWKLIAGQIRDLDYAEAITRVSEEMLQLDAVRHSFNKVAVLNLFDYIF